MCPLKAKFDNPFVPSYKKDSLKNSNSYYFINEKLVKSHKNSNSKYKVSDMLI